MVKKKTISNIKEPKLKKRKRLLTRPVLIKGIFISLIILGIIIAYKLQSAYSITYTEVIRSVEIEDNGYDSNIEGSYHIDKSANWIGHNRARIEFDLKSRLLITGGYKDVILVMDVSGSMMGEKLNRAIEDAKELTDVLLSDSNNKMALITFESTSSLITGFTNNKEDMLGYLNLLDASGSTNYNSGLLNADALMESYVKENNRDLILLFLTDGYPNVDVPNQVAAAGILKAKYPYMTINGIQYEMGKDIIKEIDEITDTAYVADQNTLHNVLFDASASPISYDNFKIIDYISSDYYVESVDDIKVSLGEVTLELENGLQKITWDLGNEYCTGKKEKMTIDVTLKEANQESFGYYPTNYSEKIISKLPDEDEKELTSEKTPVLRNLYNVVYEGNPPSDCNINYHETESYSVFEAVAKKDEELLCNGYIFKGFSIVENEVNFINDDLFIMPAYDILFRGIWSKPTIAKTMDGTVKTSYSATFDTGSTVNSKIKTIAKGSSVSYSTKDTLITKIEKASELPSGFETTSDNIISSSTSDLPIYIWFNETTGTIYYYTETERIYLNEDSSSLFYRLDVLTTLDLSDFDTSNVTNMSSMFRSCTSLIDLDLGSKFDTMNVTDMKYMFDNCGSIVNIDLGDKFYTSNVTDMGWMFRDCKKVESIDLGNEFDTSSVTNMSGMFATCSKLTNLDLGEKFNTVNVETMNAMFSSCSSLVSLDLGDNFDTSNVTTLGTLFSGCSSLISLNLGDKFNTKNVNNMVYMFSSCRSLTNLDLGDYFDTSAVTSMLYMFSNCSSLTSLDLGNKFDTSAVTNMSFMFNGCSSLISIDLGNKFDTSSVTDMKSMFYDCSNLTSLDLGDYFDTSSITTMIEMFYNCSSLEKIYTSKSFVNGNGLNSYSMFYNCISLIGGNNTVYDSTHLDATYAVIDTVDTPGYFTYKNYN